MKTYDQDIQKLQEIVTQIESGGLLSMEEYAKKVKEAGKIIESCKKKLYTMDAELQKLFDE